VSQYISSKRGGGINFNKREKSLIKKAAKEVIEKDKSLMKELYDLCILLRKSKTICEIHKSQDKNISKDCDVCFD
jgi:predicted transcriptional regulator